MPQPSTPSSSPSPSSSAGGHLARHGAVAKARLARKQAFEAFRQEGKVRIERIVAELPVMTYYDHAYTLYAGPVGTNVRQFHVFLGARPYDEGAGPDAADGPTRTLAEQGGTLLYERLDTGNVMILLYPAQTEHTRQRDDAIVLKHGVDPASLDGATLEGHLRWFAAYMAYTTLDGAASVGQWWRIAWLHVGKPYVRHKEVRRARLYRPLMWALNWFLTVALSGWFIFWLGNRPKAPDVVPDLMRAQTAEIARGFAVLEHRLATIDQHVSDVPTVTSHAPAPVSRTPPASVAQAPRPIPPTPAAQGSARHP